VTGNQNEVFRSRRRHGVRGRLGLLRAVVENGQGQALRVRSPKLAHALASALDAAVEEDSSGSTSSLPAVTRYSTSSGQRGRGETMILAAQRGRDGGQFGDGIIAITDNAELAGRVADLLNRLDPAHFKPPPKGPGFGWW
jgi:hypothetical protein